MIVYHKVFGYGRVYEMSDNSCMVFFEGLPTFRIIRKDKLMFL
jgi:hypothetical protein